MENFLPNPVDPKDNFRKDWNKLIDFQRRMQLQSSSDILVNQTTHGTSLTISDKIKKKIGGGGMNWAGVYDENASYSVNDVTVVDCNHSYSVSFDSPSGSTTPPLSAGLFLCITDVPASGSRNAYNYYYPISPTIPTSSVTSVSGSLANLTFWQPLAPMLKMTVCINNESKDYFVNGVASGSAFDMSQLPYHT
jgi:hypothetical protein